ncbi:MAG: translation elongation factor Ts [Treponema sp.]|jgi:elongation factor Ts|nr:translation elongation factor Ts [Treponema sp.]
MAEISATDVKRLREKTGAGMMECKNALVEKSGSFEEAEKLLKEKGLAALEKRSGRATNEGKVFIKVTDDSSTAVLVELSSETDFVARNPDFISLGETIAVRALEKGSTGPDDELNGLVTGLATKIRENMGLKRLTLVKAGANEYLTRYIHGDGNIGVVVKCDSDKPEIFKTEEVKAFVFSLALHIAAFNPLALDKSKVDQAWLKEQEEIFRKQMEGDEKFSKMRESKPEQFEKILQGKITKYLSEICLLDQGYVKDEKLTVGQALSEYGKKFGAQLNVNDYVYYKVGA